MNENNYHLPNQQIKLMINDSFIQMFILLEG